MRLSISNIAWEAAEDSEAASILEKYAIDAIDVAPGRYFPLPAEATSNEILHIKQGWADRGVEIVGMQSLLFGTIGLNLFAKSEVQSAMLDHLAHVCRIAEGLGASRLVFGSPKNRDRSGYTDEQALDTAVVFFRRLGDIAQRHGVTICLEPNPACYGANFMTSTAETRNIVLAVAHRSIGMQIDTGAITINGESVADEVRESIAVVKHIHASEPGLRPLGDDETDHEAMSSAFNRYCPKHIVTVEMAATTNERHATAIERALQVAVRHYRPAREIDA